MNDDQIKDVDDKSQAVVPSNSKNALVAVSSSTKHALAKVSHDLGIWSDQFGSTKDENYYAWLGKRVLIWGLGLFLLWATFAPIDKGVSAPGYVITDSNRKTIQPAVPGVVEEIYVKEGQVVKAGEVLLKINPVSAQAQSNSAREAIIGLEGQVEAIESSLKQKRAQLGLISKQVSDVRELVREGYMPRNKVMDLERMQLQIKSSILEDEGNLHKTKQAIRETKEKLNPFDFDLANTEVKSPVNGQVVNLMMFTQGGVVQPGAKLMEVVPSDDRLIIEGQLPVHLVDKVYPELPVELMFTAFNTNRTPRVSGVLLSVGADRLMDEKTGVPYYKIQATTTPAGAKTLKNLKVRPGMPVEMFVKTGEQSVMTYLLKPVFDRAHSGMRED